jgi:hypothetical protein
MLDGGAGLSSPYAWTLPTVTSQECLVKVVAEDALGNVSIDVSGLFTIDSEYPDVNIKYPNGGEMLTDGDDVTITWSASDFWPMQGFGASQAADLDIDLYYSTDGGSSWTTIATGEDNDGAYPWTVPSEDSDQCLVKVVAADEAGNEGSDTSDGVFTIAPVSDTTDPTVTVTDPNGGESYLGGASEKISWNATDDTGVTSVDLHLSTDGGVNWAVIAVGQANDGQYAWTVPNVDSDQCLVRVTAHDAAGNSGRDMSDSVFSISSDASAPSVVVERPNGGETFAGGSQEFILWSATDDVTAQADLTVNLYYKVGTGSWISIATGEDNDGEYKWSVPVIDSTQCLVKVEVSDAAGNVGFDASDDEFTISTPVRVAIADAQMAVNSTAWVPITINGVSDLASADIWLSFNSSVLQVTNITAGDLGSITSSINNTAGLVKMNWFSATGKSGDRTFANVELKAVGSAGDTSTLDLTVNELTDSDGDAIGRGVTDGMFTILALMEGDVTLNSHVTITDAMFIAQYEVGYRTLTADQLVCADTTDEGVVDVVDALLIARWLVDPTTALWDATADAGLLQPVP